MLSKEVQILNIDGSPAVGAYIIPDHGDDQTMTNEKGKAVVYALAKNEWIDVSTVSGVTSAYTFQGMPNVITLEPNSLDEVVIESNPKKKDHTPWIVGGIAAVILIAALRKKANTKKVKL